jgi:hypothetical protein
MIGCAPGPEAYFPLRKGAQWTFSVRSGLDRRVEVARVTEPTSVGEDPGWVLASDSGESRLAWRKGTLVAELLSGTRFSPPIPLLAPRSVSEERSWAGIATTMGKAYEASALLRQSSGTRELGPSKVQAIHATLLVQLPGKKVELDAWYGRGVGPMWQEQRSNGYLDRGIQYLGGP